MVGDAGRDEEGQGASACDVNGVGVGGVLWVGGVVMVVGPVKEGIFHSRYL